MEAEKLVWLSLQVTPKLKRQVRIKAARKNVSVSELVRQILEKLIEAEPEE